MKIACLAAFASLRGALLFTALASIAGAQNQTWIRQFGSGDHDRTFAAAPDGAGGVFASGRTYGSLGGPNAGFSDAWLAHYDGAGNRTWMRQLGTGHADHAAACATDGSGGVYVSGTTGDSLGGPNAGGYDVWLARYDGAGNQAWIRQFGTTDDDYAGAAAPDGSGGVFVSGGTRGSLGGAHAGGVDVWVAHFDGAGNQTWIRQLGATYDDSASAAAPDGSGGVYVSGHASGSLGGPSVGGYDALLVHYDGAGNQTWIRQFGTTVFDIVNAAAPDGAGGVYVSGFTYGSLGGQHAGGSDAWLARYDGAGNQTWTRQLGTGVHDWWSAAATDGAGGVYLSGGTDGILGGQSAGDSDALLAHYDGAGNQTWIRQLGTTSEEAMFAAAPDGAGGVFVGGFSSGSLGGPNAGRSDALLAHFTNLDATRYCTPAVPNSAGQAGVLAVTGSSTVAANNFALGARLLSQRSFGFFQTSMTQGLTVNPGGSQGNLCLGGSIGRFVGPGQVMNSGATGGFTLAVGLSALPTPTGFVSVQPGDTWNFQAWYRDANPGPTSNFTDALSVTFL